MSTAWEEFESGQLIPLDEWLQGVDDLSWIDTDGHGSPAAKIEGKWRLLDEDAYYPSDFSKNFSSPPRDWPEGTTHVCWWNK